MRKLFEAGVLGAMAIAVTGTAWASDGYVATPCAAAATFDTPESLAAFPVVLDGIMGGRSSGTRFFQDGYMVFRGVINTNGGGFSSIRSRVRPGSFGDADGIRFGVRQDARRYLLMAHNGQNYRRRRISFGGLMPNPAPGEWVDVVVPFETLTGDVSGRRVPMPEGGFDPDSVFQFGIEIADGIDGPFSIDVAGVECVRRVG